MSRFASTLYIAAVLSVGSAFAAADDDRSRDRSARELIFSASAVLEAEAASTVIAEVPAGSAFLLTQFCQSAGDFGPFLAGTSFGPVPGEGNCTTYTPGVLIAGGQALVCAARFPLPEPAGCLVTGFLRKAR